MLNICRTEDKRPSCRAGVLLPLEQGAVFGTNVCSWKSGIILLLLPFAAPVPGCSLRSPLSPMCVLCLHSENMVRGLDEDETHFLDEVSRQQELLEKQRREEELKELNEYRISFVLARLWSRGGGDGAALGASPPFLLPQRFPERAP